MWAIDAVPTDINTWFQAVPIIADIKGATNYGLLFSTLETLSQNLEAFSVLATWYDLLGKLAAQKKKTYIHKIRDVKREPENR